MVTTPMINGDNSNDKWWQSDGKQRSFEASLTKSQNPAVHHVCLDPVTSLNVFALSINAMAPEGLKSKSHPLQSSSPWLVWRIPLQGWSEDWEEEKQKRSWDCHGSAETGLFLVGLRSLARIWNFTFTLGSVRLCCSITIREAYKSHV